MLTIGDLIEITELLPEDCPAPTITRRINFSELTWHNLTEKKYVTLDYYTSGKGTIFTITETEPMLVEDFNLETLCSRIKDIGMY